MEPVTVAVAAAVLLAIVEVVKRTVNAWAIDPPDPDRYAPALTVLLGIVGGATGVVDDVGWFGGLVAALTASGAYAGSKATVRSARGS